MALGTSDVPVFQLPPEESHFLASESHLYDYANLYAFSNRLNDELMPYRFTEKKPFLIISQSSDELVFLIAGLFLLKIPFLIIHPGSDDTEIKQVLEYIDPVCFYTDEYERFSHVIQAPRITLAKKWLIDEQSADASLFSLSNPEEIAGLFLTSGTTHTPKIVPIKRRQIFFAAHSSAENFKPEVNRYWLLCLPLNHIGGISIILRSILYNSAVFRMDHFNVEDVRTFLSENKLFEVASLVPTMLIRVLEDPLFQVHSGFKAILLGGGPISLDLINKSVTRGIPVVSSYGMTESCAQIAANAMLNPSGTYPPKASAGTVFPPNQIQIRDENGKIQPPLEQGQIWLKGPQIFDGYLVNELNKDVFDEEGWFNTGDFGHLNRNNQLFIENRRSDLIITGGENVNPLKVETALNELPHVVESAVIGIPDPKWGQRIVAFIIPGDHSFKEDQIRNDLQKKLQGFQIPKEFIEVSELPKSSIGKIKKVDLIRLYEQKLP
jgi:o-succinylbenzoate---CoA ligase